MSSQDSKFLRIPNEISINLNKGSQKPEGDWPLKRRIKKRLIHYKIDIKKGGYSGDLYILTAWESVSNGYIHVEQHTYTERSDPDLSLLWIVIRGIAFNDK